MGESKMTKNQASAYLEYHHKPSYDRGFMDGLAASAATEAHMKTVRLAELRQAKPVAVQDKLERTL